MCESRIKQDDDIFHGITMTEESSYQSGFEEGLRHSIKRDTEEGFRLGVEKGIEIGREIGFYSGFASHILEEKEQNKLSSRTIKVCHDIISLAIKVTQTDPTDDDLTDTLGKVKGKFKQLTSLLGVQTQYTAGDVKGASF